jgi:hypothetical protein
MGATQNPRLSCQRTTILQIGKEKYRINLSPPGQGSHNLLHPAVDAPKYPSTINCALSRAVLTAERGKRIADQIPEFRQLDPDPEIFPDSILQVHTSPIGFPAPRARRYQSLIERKARRGCERSLHPIQHQEALTGHPDLLWRNLWKSRETPISHLSRGNPGFPIKCFHAGVM